MELIGVPNLKWNIHGEDHGEYHVEYQRKKKHWDNFRFFLGNGKRFHIQLLRKAVL